MFFSRRHVYEFPAAPYRVIIDESSKTHLKGQNKHLKDHVSTYFSQYIEFNDDFRFLMLNIKKTIEIGSHFEMIKVLRVFLREIIPLKLLSFMSKKVALKFRDYFHFFMTVLSDTFSVPYDKKIIIILRWARG